MVRATIEEQWRRGDRTGESGSRTARLSDFDPVVRELRTISERMAVLVAAVAASGKLKAPVLPSLPRPIVAAEKIRRELEMAQHRWVLSKVLAPEEVTPDAELPG